MRMMLERRMRMNKKISTDQFLNWLIDELQPDIFIDSGGFKQIVVLSDRRKALIAKIEEKIGKIKK